MAQENTLNHCCYCGGPKGIPHLP